MIRILRIPTAPGAPSSPFSAERDLTRFTFVTNLPAWGTQHLEFRFDGVTSIRMTGSTTIAKHPMAEGGPVADHHEPSPTNFQIEAWLSSPLQEDQVGDERAQVSAVQDGDRLFRIVPTSARTQGLSARAQDVLRSLGHALGVPCTIYTPRFGVLGPYALVGFDAGHEARDRISFALSFEEYRIAGNVSQVILPVIPRVRIQEPPNSAGDWSLAGLENSAAELGPSIWKVSTGSEYGPSPDAPLANKQYAAIDGYSRFGDLLDSRIGGSLR